jgi:hypothetical protein
MEFDQPNDLPGVLRSNERRLDDLHDRAVRIDVDAPTVLRFVLDLVLATNTAPEYRRRWASNVAGFLNELESPGTAHRAVA